MLTADWGWRGNVVPLYLVHILFQTGEGTEEGEPECLVSAEFSESSHEFKHGHTNTHTPIAC